MKEMLEKLFNEEGEKPFKAIKSIPMTPAQIKEYKELTAHSNKIIAKIEVVKKDLMRHVALKKKFWATVETELGLYGALHANPDKFEIEVGEDNK